MILIIGSVVFNYALGLLLAHPSRAGTVEQKCLLILGIAANLGLLGFFKYANFFVDSANTLLDFEVQLAPIILPLAISFFTFQQITYLCDIRSDRIPRHDFIHYCLYVTFFPQLIAGPIVRSSEILSQYTEKKSRSFNHEDFAIGLTIFIIGLFKKVVIANGIALSSTPVFQAAQDGILVSFFDAWARRSPTPFNCIPIFPDIRTWPSAWVACLVFACLSTLILHTRPTTLLISGGAGT